MITEPVPVSPPDTPKPHRSHQSAPPLKSWAFVVEPPWGIEPQTYALREARYTVLGSLPALIAALRSLNALRAQCVPDPGPRPGPRRGRPPGNSVLPALLQVVVTQC